MARELERAVVTLVSEILDATVLPTPEWLIRPGRVECATQWPLVQAIYRSLTGLDLPEVMRPVERRTVDAVLQRAGEPARILEVDERQHFNEYRAITLRGYPPEVPLAFDLETWLRRSEEKTRLEGGGFAAPRPPLFPGAGGRHRQRAFRDALCDLLPPEHGYLPTLRVGHFEVETWIDREDGKGRMVNTLADKLSQDT